VAYVSFHTPPIRHLQRQAVDGRQKLIPLELIQNVSLP
jgi:hypothetical protein